MEEILVVLLVPSIHLYECWSKMRSQYNDSFSFYGLMITVSRGQVHTYNKKIIYIWKKKGIKDDCIYVVTTD
jgi:hypothetical protein